MSLRIKSLVLIERKMKDFHYLVYKHYYYADAKFCAFCFLVHIIHERFLTALAYRSLQRHQTDLYIEIVIGFLQL